MTIEIKGDFSKGREKMKDYRAAALKGIKQFEGKERKSRTLTVKEKEEFDALKKSIPVYSLSKTFPAKYKGIIINSKLLKAFLKKLKGLSYEIFPYEDKIRVRYGKIYGEWTGTLELYDLSRYFEDFNDIPEMEIKQ